MVNHAVILELINFINLQHFVKKLQQVAILGRVKNTGPIYYYVWFPVKFSSDCEC